MQSQKVVKGRKSRGLGNLGLAWSEGGSAMASELPSLGMSRQRLKRLQQVLWGVYEWIGIPTWSRWFQKFFPML